MAATLKSCFPPITRRTGACADEFSRGRLVRSRAWQGRVYRLAVDPQPNCSITMDLACGGVGVLGGTLLLLLSTSFATRPVPVG